LTNVHYTRIINVAMTFMGRDDLAQDSLTKIEDYLLLDIMRLGQASSSDVWADYCQRADDTIAIGQIHATLDRMQRKGFVASRLESVVTADGKARNVRYYRPTEKGKRALQRSRDTWNAFADVSSLLL
jgi:DNA-binding PadR family transcriptional regulator